MNTDSKWMMVSGVTGFTFFILANFTNIFSELNITSAILQLFVNAFVFFTWTNAFLQNTGFKKFVAFFGIIVPFIMASITIYRVLIPIF